MIRTLHVYRSLPRYKTLAKVFGEGVSTRVVLLKCLCDQLFFATQQDFLFLLLCAYSDRKQLPQAIEEVKRTFLPTWLIDCSLWPVVNFVGFAMVPYTLQPTYMACVQFFWQIYLSSVAAKEESSAKSCDPSSDLKKSVNIPHYDPLTSPRLIAISRSNDNIYNADRYWMLQDARKLAYKGESDVYQKHVLRAQHSYLRPECSSLSLLVSRNHDMQLKPSARTALKRYSDFQAFPFSKANVKMLDIQLENEVNTAMRSSGIGLSVLVATAVVRTLLYKI